MCGRYLITSPPDVMRRFFGYVEQPNFPPRYNIAPTQPVPIVRRDGDARAFALMRWGFLPGFVKDPKTFPLIINARAETALDKPSFRNAFKRRRCVFPADGFYEWLRDGAKKRPFFIRRCDGAPLALAGLWETWVGPNGEELDTACILTVGANGDMAGLHDRMPAMLEPAMIDPWLDCAAVEAAAAQALLRPAVDGALTLTEVNAAVNKATNEGPHLHDPAVAATLV